MVCSALREPSYCGLKKPHELLKKKASMVASEYYFMCCVTLFHLEFLFELFGYLGICAKKRRRRKNPVIYKCRNELEEPLEYVNTE